MLTSDAIEVGSWQASSFFMPVGAVIAYPMATPPDVISQVTLAIPLYALFELGILLSWFAERKKKLEQASQ